jgi:SAM-dependent methyltransferase
LIDRSVQSKPEQQRPSEPQFGRVRWARLLVAENGIRWTAYAAALGGLKKASRFVQGRMARLERRYRLSGRNSVGVNYEYWQRWDWSRQGEEWTPSEEWKQSLIDDVMLRHVQPGTTILEIGPGAGRWTEALQPIAGRLIVVDLSDRCIELCRQRFANAPNIEFHVNDGRSLAAIPTATVDGIWSFDVFVHIAPPEIAAYMAEIARVMRPGAQAVVHHAAAGREADAADLGQRSNMTAERFAEMARRQGLTVIEQFDSWGPDGRFKPSTGWDIISVVEK